MNWWKLLTKTAGKTLYHGTSIDNVDNIKTLGLQPNVGEFTSNAYQEHRDAGIELPELTFAADKQGLRSAVSAMMAAVSKMMGRSFMDNVTADDLARYGALVVIRDSEAGGPAQPSNWDHRPHHDDGNDDWSLYNENSHPQVEPGDYYSENSQKASYVLTGKKMVDFLAKQGFWPSSRFEDQKSLEYMKQKLINIQMGEFQRKSPQTPKNDIYQEVAKSVAALTPDQIRYDYHRYFKER